MPKTSLFIKDHASQCRNVVRRGDLNSFLKALWDNTALTQKTRIFLSCLLFVSVPHNSFFFFVIVFTDNKQKPLKVPKIVAVCSLQSYTVHKDKSQDCNQFFFHF